MTMSQSHSQAPSRVGTPSNGVRREAFLNLAEGEQQQLTSFHAFGYPHHLDAFNLNAASSGARTDAGTNAIYDTGSVMQHHPQLSGDGTPSMYQSPTSGPSSPSPHYGDFNPFPLSPSQNGGTILSFINQQAHPHQTTLSPGHPQTLSPGAMASTSNQPSFDLSHSSNLPQHLPHPTQSRRDSCSSRPDRRHSSASVASMRNFQPPSPFSHYNQMGPSATGPHSSPMYGPSVIPEDDMSPGSLYANHSRPSCSSSSSMNSSPSIIRAPPPVAMGVLCQGQTMGPPMPPPPTKTGTRQYRKKTPPEACAVCGNNQTPEWRKGPSGLRTLCNACGLTAAKLSAPEANSVEEVWHQLREVGLNRFRGNYVLSEEQKSSAAQSWMTQAANNNPGRNLHPSRVNLAPSSLNSPHKSLRTASGRPNQNLSEVDAAQQLYTMSRGRGNSLGAPIAMHSPGQPPSPLGLSHPYVSSLPAHPGSLEIDDRFQHMTCTAAEYNGLSPALVAVGHYPSSPVLSPGTQHPGHVMGLYSGALTEPAAGHAHDGRRNSIEGHRMSISSIINQDPPSRPSSTINSHAHIHQLQQQQIHHMHSLLLRPTQNGYPKQI